jgi:hypothetical protein
MIDDPEILRNVIRSGILMRAKQREYFKTRDRSVLVESKQLEKNFDEAAADAVSTPGAAGAGAAGARLL